MVKRNQPTYDIIKEVRNKFKDLKQDLSGQIYYKPVSLYLQ